MKRPEAAKRPGRPPSGTPKKGAGGKGRVLTLNVSEELRAFIEAEAANTGRSMSQIAERWMEDARKGLATLETLVGNYDLVPVVAKLGEVAREIATAKFEPEFRNEAIRTGWTDALEFLLPPPPGPLVIQTTQATEAFKTACASLLQAIGRQGKRDPLYKAATAGTMIEEAGTLSNALRPGGGLTPVEILSRGADLGSWALTEVALRALGGVDDPVRAEVAAVATAQRKLVALADVIHAGVQEAKAEGVAASRRVLGIPMLPASPQ